MSKVAIIQQVYNSSRWAPLVYPAIFNQTFTDFTLYVQVVLDDGSAENYIRQHYPQAVVSNPGFNIGFARGHNEIFANTDHEFYQLVNPDLILEPDYLEKVIAAASDNQIGALTGKILRYNLEAKQKTNIIDTTGIVIYKTGRARDRGQLEIDTGQYDGDVWVSGVSGCSPLYRKSALEAVAVKNRQDQLEYYDESFHSYWEDVDLSWRIYNAGYKLRYVPTAVAYHGRTAGANKGGYKNLLGYIKHHSSLPLKIRQLNYRNHIYLFIKNSPRLYWKFFIREFFMLGYILLFEIHTLRILPNLIAGLPEVWQKRRLLASGRRINLESAEKIFSKHPTDL